MSTQPKLHVDPARLAHATLRGEDFTGIYVRAWYDGRCGSYDIDVLDKTSLLAFLRIDGGENPMAENVVGVLLGHGHLHTNNPEPARG